MIDLSQYGEILRRYRGKGTIINEDKTIECDFDVAQFLDGNIRLHFALPSSPVPFIDDEIGNEGSIVFRGIIEDERNLEVEGKLFRLTSTIDHGKTDLAEFIFINTGPVRLRVGQLNLNAEVELKFGITNFTFIGTNAEATGSNSWRRILSLQLEGKQILIRPLKDYDKREKRLRARKDVNITCEGCIKINFPEEAESARGIIDILCGLLTIAKGTLISHLYFDVILPDGTLTQTEHYPYITRKYANGLPTIDYMPPERIRDFVQQCYEPYRNLLEEYKFDRVVYAFANARFEAIHLETRALALVTLVDYLADRFTNLNSRHSIMDTRAFRELRDTLKKSISEFVKGSNFSLKSTQEKELQNKLDGFNYRSFRSKLYEMLSYFRVPISDDEIATFVRSRNQLVHYFSFKTSDEAQEYSQLLHFLDKLLLRMLDYEGFYINVTDLDGHVGEDKYKLTPTP